MSLSLFFLISYELRHEISNNVVCVTSNSSDKTAHSMTVKLPAKQLLEFLSLKRGCTGSSESKLVKMQYCWKSCVTAPIISLSLPLLILECFNKNVKWSGPI